MELDFENEITPGRFAEIGVPACGFRREDGKVIALCSEFPMLYWPGRAVYEGHTLRYRLSLYERNCENLIAVFDSSRFPVNDVAFHPSEPIAAIATGSYDGGWAFEGDLWLWNWETGETSTLLGESREVVRCRFDSDNRLAALLRPRDEEEFPFENGDEAFDTVVGLYLDNFTDISQNFPPSIDPRLEDLMPINPTEMGFEDRGILYEDRVPTFFTALEIDATEFRKRARIWDLCWLNSEQIAAVHDFCYVEVWNMNGTCDSQFTGSGNGLQLFRQNHSLLVHVIERANRSEGREDRSKLYRLQSDELKKLINFENPVTISNDYFGNLLCRDVGHRNREQKRKDLLLKKDFSTGFAGDLGHYDSFNHYIRIDGGDGLYFLRGTPPESYKMKQLCKIHPDGAIEHIKRWDLKEGHLMNSSACLTPDNTIVRTYQLYQPQIKSSIHIERISLISKQIFWKHSLTAPVTAMIPLDKTTLAYALTDGTFGLIDIETGEKLFHEKLSVDHLPTVAMSMAWNEKKLAIGTIDGRILIYEIPDFINSAP